jgi:gliding motility-associated-like protein
VLPNVFSPNGSGVNNFFTPVRDANGKPQFNDILWFDLKIYNRWGSLVFETKDENLLVNQGWDGRDMTTGKDCAEGVYFYTFTYQPIALKPQPQKTLTGNVTLFR